MPLFKTALRGRRRIGISRARYYDAQVGRFISEDPIGFEGGINQFSYTSNNPVNFVDPMGLAKMFCRNLGSFAGSVFKQKHCYIVADNSTKYGLYPSGNMFGGALIGVPVINDPRDIGGQCFNCPAKDCEDQNKCLEKAHNQYPIGVYRLLGPNSNTYAGTLARSCCKGGVPAGVSNAPGINDSPPNQLSGTFVR